MAEHNRTNFGWCVIPLDGGMQHVFMHAGSFSDNDFMNYYMELAGGHMTSIDSVACTAIMPQRTFDELFGTLGMWECQHCHQIPEAQMQKCSGCFVKYCSSACQKDDWKLHKPFCKTLTTLRETRYVSSQFQKDKYKEIIRFGLKTGMGFQMITQGRYQMIRSIVGTDGRSPTGGA